MLNLGNSLSNKLNDNNINNLTEVNFECNKLDRTISEDKYKEKELKNDIHANELRFGSSSRFNKNNKRKLDETSLTVNNATPVTLISIRGRKKNRTVIRRDLRVLLDSGSSHSMASARCAKAVSLKTLKKSRDFATAGGNFAIDHEATINFNLSELDFQCLQ